MYIARKSFYTIILLFVFQLSFAYADNLSMGNVEGLRYDKMGRYVGGKARVRVAYNLKSKGAKSIVLMVKCPSNGGATSIDRSVVAKGSGNLTMSGKIPRGCGGPSFYVMWTD